MGLCKCPRRRVTPLFCFEHRVNVCESCMLSSHPKCVVQSYLRWLQDSDYEPNCPLCHRELRGGDTVRLVCYDVVHWRCLCSRCRSLPPRTAPAGFRCPSCSAPLFPPPDTRGPVADALRSRLATVAWARPGLGLPLIEDADAEPEPSDSSEWGGAASLPPPPSPPPAQPPLRPTRWSTWGGARAWGCMALPHGRRCGAGRTERPPRAQPRGRQIPTAATRGGAAPPQQVPPPRPPPGAVAAGAAAAGAAAAARPPRGGGFVPTAPLGAEPLRPGR